MSYDTRIQSLQEFGRIINGYTNDVEDKYSSIENKCNESIEGWNNSEAISWFEQYKTYYLAFLCYGKTLVQQIVDDVDSQIEYLREEKQNLIDQYEYMTKYSYEHDKEKRLAKIRELDIDESAKDELVNKCIYGGF